MNRFSLLEPIYFLFLVQLLQFFNNILMLFSKYTIIILLYLPFFTFTIVKQRKVILCIKLIITI